MRNWTLLFAIVIVGLTNTIICQLNTEATIGFSVRDMATNSTIMAQNSTVSYTPASLTKLISTGIALELLGPNYRFTTNLKYTGSLDIDGTLNGNLVIVGSGDPTIGSKYFDSKGVDFIDDWVDAVINLGIKQIKGKIIADVSVFGNEPLPRGAIWEDIGNYYGSGVNAISALDNRYKVIYKPTPPAHITQIESVQPEIEQLVITCYAKATNRKTDSSYIYGDPWNYRKVIFGEIPANKTGHAIYGSIPEPALFVARLFAKALSKKIQGVFPCEISVTSVSGTTFYSHYSPKLIDIILQTNYLSLNHFALNIFEKAKFESGTTFNSANFVNNFVRTRWGLPWQAYIEDGAGISVLNAISPNELTLFLECMATKAMYSNEYINSLPLAGISGTVANLKLDLPEKWVAHIKSGSMSGVKCYAGYIGSVKKKYAFALMVNNKTASPAELTNTVKIQINRIVKAILQYDKKTI